jgi:integrase
VPQYIESKRINLIEPARFHDLRGSHGTALLNAGEPIHEVAKRLGHDPATLLAAYAKQTDEGKAKLVKSVAGMGLL